MEPWRHSSNFMGKTASQISEKFLDLFSEEVSGQILGHPPPKKGRIHGGLAIKSTEFFYQSGPSDLTDVDWRNEDHQRIILACLVQGTYVGARDRQMQRLVPCALAPPWWEFFNFQVIEELRDPKDWSTIGIVYKYIPTPRGHMGMTHAPDYVIAFRGTILECATAKQDLKLDLAIFGNTLHLTSRFKLAMEAVENVVEAFPGCKIWIAGHSLGSAIGMLVGKNMARKNIFLKGHFFNPPFPSAPIEKIGHVIRTGSSLFTTSGSVAMKRCNERSQSDDQFIVLSPWVPYLYVHPVDLICSKYIGYFERMEEMGAGGIERLATQTSVSNLLLNAMGMDSDPLHLLPSARLIINHNPAEGCKQAHGLHNWWMLDLHLEDKEYKY